MKRDIHEVLKSVWGYDHFRPMQETVVRDVLAGKDTLALLPTGGGKSLCFQVPALAMGKMCLVVSPLIALMTDQVERLRKCGIRAKAVTSGMDHVEMDNALESAALGKWDFLYVSPERLGSELFAARSHRMPIGLIAVDEAHCISQWGYDFRPAYRLIGELRKTHPSAPVIALTASATTTVAQDIMVQLAFKEPHIVRGPFHRPELTHWISHGEDRMGRLLRIARNTEGTAIIYLRDRRGTVATAHFLMQHGITAEAYHAGLSFAERERVQQAWSEGKIRFVAATNAFGMGIDKADVRCVIHLEAPPDMESYYQESGRAGRDGKPAYAFLLTRPGDEAKLRAKVDASFPSISEVRRVYQAFADQHRIALGSGSFEAYTVDLRELARRTAMPAAMVNHALKALELNGDIALSDGARSPSRVLMRAAADVIYRMRVEDARSGPVLEAMLRLKGGLFEEAAIIDEEEVSKLLGWSVHRVSSALRELDKDHVIFYRARNDSPTATLLTPRRDAQRLMLNKEALHDREKRARERLEAMVRFAFHADTCREVTVLSYFGEELAQECGRCDVCKAKGASADGGSRIEKLNLARWMADEHPKKNATALQHE